MELILEVIIQFLGEILLQMLFELMAEMGLRSLSNPFQRPRNNAFSAVGFTLYGAAAGIVSLWIFPSSAFSRDDLRAVNLIVTPCAVGAIMMLIGKVRDKKDQRLVRLDRFFYAFIFAFSMALVRFIWAS